jgi:hypothetical protein
MAVPDERTALAFVRLRAEAKLAWAVDLHTLSGHVHRSLAGTDLTDPFAARPDLDAVVGVEPRGRCYGLELLVIKRTITWGYDLEEIPAGTVAPPTDAEVTAVNQALDFLGYTGPRQLRLLLALDCT